MKLESIASVAAVLALPVLLAALPAWPQAASRGLYLTRNEP